MIQSSVNIDQQVRLIAFDWLSKQTKIYGDVLPRILLEKGFEFEGKRTRCAIQNGKETEIMIQCRRNGCEEGF